MDNFPKVLEMLGIRSTAALTVTPEAVLQAGVRVCRQDWEHLLEAFPGYMPYRAQRACFGAAYIYVLLTDIYGMSSASASASAGGRNNTTSFTAVDSLGSRELSWALGAAVHMSLETGALRPFAS